MDKTEFEAELSRLEALAEVYAAMVYEAPDPTTATGYLKHGTNNYSLNLIGTLEYLEGLCIS
jgi:hypothetical protein